MITRSDRTLPGTIIRVLRLRYQRYQARRVLMKAATSPTIRLVVGAGGTAFEGWIPTDIDSLNLLNQRDWNRYFEPNSVTAILAEHVWEHLTAEDGRVAARHCHRYLRPGGHLRIAVPDGLHPDPAYIRAVKPGGTGTGALDHQVLFTHESLGLLLSDVGFTVRLLEYFDRQGCFHEEPWESSGGMVRRSRRFDTRNAGGQLVYTSLIVDAIKP
jgi:predicted SAM-dependent methyltransferase